MLPAASSSCSLRGGSEPPAPPVRGGGHGGSPTLLPGYGDPCGTRVGGPRVMLGGIRKPKRTEGTGDPELASRSQQVRRASRGPGAWRHPGDPRVGSGRGAVLRAWRHGAGAVLAVRPLPSSLPLTLWASPARPCPRPPVRGPPAPSAPSPLAAPRYSSFFLDGHRTTPARCTWRLSLLGTSLYQVSGVFFAPAEAGVVEVPVAFHCGHLVTGGSGLMGTGQSLALSPGQRVGAGVASCSPGPAR